MEHHCQCEAAGNCPLFRRVMNRRQHDICRGYDRSGNKSIAEDRRELHVRKWIQDAAEQQGLGDEIKAVTEAVGISQCSPCKQRQITANQKFQKQHWLTRSLAAVTRFLRIRQPPAIDLPRFDHTAWQIDTAQVAPRSITQAEGQPFPVHFWDGQTTQPKRTTFVWVYVAALAESDEIQFSIRSVRKFVPDADIVICGDRPPGFEGTVIRSPQVTVKSVRHRFGYKPSQRFIKWVDSIAKLQAIIESPHVSDDFLWMYDDTFICRPTTFEELAIPRYSRRNVPVDSKPKQRRKDAWQEVRRRTFNNLHASKLPAADYSTHFPTAYNKRLLQKTIAEFAPWKNPRLIESLYLNHHSSPKARPVWQDLTYVKANTLARLDRENHLVINIGHGAWHQSRDRIAGITGTS